MASSSFISIIFVLIIHSNIIKSHLWNLQFLFAAKWILCLFQRLGKFVFQPFFLEALFTRAPTFRRPKSSHDLAFEPIAAKEGNKSTNWNLSGHKYHQEPTNAMCPIRVVKQASICRWDPNIDVDAKYCN